MTKLRDAPVYTVPMSGILSSLPRAWVPYAELMRLHKPAGFVCISCPYIFGTLLAASTYTAPEHQDPNGLIYACLTMLFLGSLLRSLSCTFNDIMDADLDRQVDRCRLRPMARGAVQVSDAYAFCLLQLVVLLGTLSLATDTATALLFLPALVLHAVYPLVKRVSHYPQVFLGVTLSYGVCVGASHSGLGPRSWPSHPAAAAAIAFLTLSYLVWSIIHDTIYGFQDIVDDKKAGIKSMSIAYETQIQLLLGGLSVLPVALNAAAGYCVGFGAGYYVGACAGIAVLCIAILRDLDVNDVGKCEFWFKHGSLAFALLVTAGLASQCALPPVQGLRVMPAMVFSS